MGAINGILMGVYAVVHDGAILTFFYVFHIVFEDNYSIINFSKIDLQWKLLRKISPNFSRRFQ